MLLKRLQLWDLRLLFLRSISPIREEKVVISQVNQFSQRLPIAMIRPKDRKRKMEASEDKAIRKKICKAETVSRNERQKKELAVFTTGRIPLF